MIPLSNNSKPSYSRGEHFKGEHLHYLRSTMSTIILLIALLLVLVFSQLCTADSRYNYDTHHHDAHNHDAHNYDTHNYDAHNYDALHITALKTHGASLFTSQARTHTAEPTHTVCNLCNTRRAKAISAAPLRWLLPSSFSPQIHELVLISDYNAPSNSVLETCWLLVKNAMSQYRAYFVPRRGGSRRGCVSLTPITIGCGHVLRDYCFQALRTAEECANVAILLFYVHPDDIMIGPPVPPIFTPCPPKVILKYQEDHGNLPKYLFGKNGDETISTSTSRIPPRPSYPA